jgi:lipid A ethanolaminephosphotransferase
MVYISDHGESLGENNIYLHGLPYKFAPDTQKHVPAVIWSPKSNRIDADSLSSMVNAPVSHDFITPTLLTFFGITTDEVKSAPTFFKMNN